MRETPSFSTMASSAMREPLGSSPARIISRSRSCAFTAWEAPASAGSGALSDLREWLSCFSYVYMH